MPVETPVAELSSRDSDTSQRQKVCHAFTVDVEDYFQVSAYEQVISRDQWREMPSRVVRNTIETLDLLDSADVKGTFFVLGWVADEFPSLVKEIADRGHELGCHSYWHRLVFEQTPEEFREDLVDARRAIEDASGVVVKCYRAPSFSVTKKSDWAVEILAEEGFDVDSSIFPVHHDRYGVPDAPREIHRLETPHGSLVEFPPSVHRVGKVNLPISGGGYFRLYPYAMTRRLLATTHRESGEPFMFYIHPWEIDPDQPKMKHPSKAMYWRHRVNLKRTKAKLKRLLSDFSFGTLSDALASSRALQD